MCDTCGRPQRSLWTFENYPQLAEVKVGNWIALQRCPECSALWCEVPHEPYASFTFLTAWPFDEQAWQSVHDIDEARPLHEWHDAVIRENWEELPRPEREAVERWRDRTYRHYNPIDRGPEVPKPKYIHVASELASVVSSVIKHDG